MSNEKYVAPEMDIIEFGNEDLVCDILSTNGTDYKGDHVDVPDFGGSYDGGDFES